MKSGLDLSPSAGWKPRLYLPAYQLAEAARYSQVVSQTVTAWHREDKRKVSALPARDRRQALSYMQLIEVAVVAALRNRGMPPRRIRDARDYMAQQLKAEFPFAEHKFKTEGKHIWVDFKRFKAGSLSTDLVGADLGGQLAWNEVIGKKLEEFSYDEGIAVQWKPVGKKSRIVIDPRTAFGAPAIRGVPTWALLARWKSHEPVDAIAEDFSIASKDVKEALVFEGVAPKNIKIPSAWAPN